MTPLNRPVSLVTILTTSSLFVQVIVVPAAIVIVAGLNPIPEIITSVVSVPPLNPELSLGPMVPVKSDIVFFVQPFKILNMIKRIAIIIADLLLEPIKFFILMILVKSNKRELILFKSQPFNSFITSSIGVQVALFILLRTIPGFSV